MSDFKRALTGVSGAAMLNVGLTAAAGILAARFVGPEGQGKYALVTAVVTFTVMLMSLGTGLALRIRAGGAPSPRDARAYAGYSLLVTPLAGVVGLIAAASRGGTLGLALAGFLYAAASMLVWQLQEGIQAYGRLAHAYLGAAGGALVQVGVVLVATQMLAPSISVVLIAASIGFIAQILIGMRTLRVSGFPGGFTLNTRRWGDLIGLGWKSLGNSLGMQVMQRADRVLLVTMAGERAAGLYAVAATLAEMTRLLSLTVGQLLFVRVTATGAHDRQSKLIVRLALLAEVVMVLTLWVLAPWVVPLVFGEAFRGSVPLLRGLLVAEAFMGLALMEGRIAMALGGVGAVSVATVGALIMAMLSYAVLIPRLGSMGAVVGTVTGYLLYALLIGLLLRRMKYTGRHRRAV